MLTNSKESAGNLKGTVQQDFGPRVFFIIRIFLGHWPWLKYFRFWLVVSDPGWFK